MHQFKAHIRSQPTPPSGVASGEFVELVKQLIWKGSGRGDLPQKRGALVILTYPIIWLSQIWADPGFSWSWERKTRVLFDTFWLWFTERGHAIICFVRGVENEIVVWSYNVDYREWVGY